MSFQNLVSVAVLSLISFVSQTAYVEADDSLTLKVELKHGTDGPIRQPIVSAGERLNFCLNISGLSRNKNNKFDIRVKSELRDEAGELLSELPESDTGARYVSHFSTNKYCIGLSYPVPREQPKGHVTAVFIVKDLVAESEIRKEFKIEVKRPTGAYPVALEYLRVDPQGYSTSGSGRFMVGESIRVQFWLTGFADSKQIKCKLEYIRKNTTEPIASDKFASEVPANYRKVDGVPGQFSFLATEPFEGKIRLTVTDDAGNSNSMEMPLEVTEPLRLGEATLIAEKPATTGEKSKKE